MSNYYYYKSDAIISHRYVCIGEWFTEKLTGELVDLVRDIDGEHLLYVSGTRYKLSTQTSFNKKELTKE